MFRHVHLNVSHNVRFQSLENSSLYCAKCHVLTAKSSALYAHEDIGSLPWNDQKPLKLLLTAITKRIHTRFKRSGSTETMYTVWPHGTLFYSEPSIFSFEYWHRSMLIHSCRLLRAMTAPLEGDNNKLRYSQYWTAFTVGLLDGLHDL